MYQERKGSWGEKWEIKSTWVYAASPIRLKGTDTQIYPEHASDSKDYLRSKRRQQLSLHKCQNHYGSSDFHTSMDINPGQGYCDLFPPGPGRCLSTEKERDACVALSNMATKIITGSNHFFDFCFWASARQKGLQRALPTAITTSFCNVARTEHSRFSQNLRVVYYHSMFWDNGVQ